MVTDPVSLNSLSFSVVGPGNVGVSLAHWLIALGARLRQVSSRDGHSAATFAEAQGGLSTPLASMSSAEEDLLIVAVTDPALDEVTETLSRRPQASVVLHTSGRFSAEVLAALRPQGSAVGSLHPLKAFPTALVDRSEATGTVFGIDGDPAAEDLASTLVGALGGITVRVPSAVRSQYHLAATLAAGGVVTLLASAAELARTIGLSPTVARGYLELARGAILQAGKAESIGSAITGPVARGDLEGLLAQIEEVRSIDPELADLLELLAHRTRLHCEKPRPKGP